MIVFFQSLKREVERRIDVIPRIVYEPQLINDDSCYILQPGSELPPHYFRLKAVDDIKLLGTYLNNFITQYIDEDRQLSSIFIRGFRDYERFNSNKTQLLFLPHFLLHSICPVICSGISTLSCCTMY
jgi:hypothetical protein